MPISTVFNAATYATGGAGTATSPYTSASGTGGIQEGLQALVNASVTAGVVYAPAGYYLITTPIDFTFNASTQIGNLVGAGGITFAGDGAIETILVGQTSGIVIDTTGRGHLTLRDFGIIQAATSKSTLGIFQARATTGYAQFPQHNVTERVYIDFASSATANGNHGTIGIYNTGGAESCLYQDVQINADNPIILTADNTFSLSSPYQTLLTTARFCTNNHIRGGAFWSTGSAASNGSIIIQGRTDNTIIDGPVLQKASATTSNPTYAIWILPDALSVSQQICGIVLRAVQVETYAGLLSTSAPLWGAKIAATIAQDAAISIIRLNSSVASFIGSEINVTPAQSVTATQLIYDGGSATGGVKNSTIFLPSPLWFQLPSSPSVSNRVYTEASAPSVTSNAFDAGRILDTSAGVSLGGLILPSKALTLSNGANENIDVSNASYVRITGPTGAFSIGGFVAGADGKILHVWNHSGQAMTITNLSVGSSGGNRLYTNSGANVTLRSGDSFASFIYDATGAVWVLMSTN